MKLELTKTQIEILKHRLEVADSLADVLDGYHPSDVDVVCFNLLESIGPAAIDTAEADRINRHITKAVLIDCVEGSTFIACTISDDANERKINSAIQALENLAAKIETAYDLPADTIDYPTH